MENDLDNLAKACIALLVLQEREDYFLSQTHEHMDEIGAGEIVVLTITRRHAQPQPVPVEGVAGERVYI